MVLAGEIEHIEAVARAYGVVAVSLQHVVEELHVELMVLHDHHCLRHLPPPGKFGRRATARRARLRTARSESLVPIRYRNANNDLRPRAPQGELPLPSSAIGITSPVRQPEPPTPAYRGC